MPFSQPHHDWLIDTVSSAPDFDAILARQDERNSKLAEMRDEITDLQDELIAASTNLKVEWPRDKFLGLIERSNRSMDWMNGDRDDEVDTKHDLTGNYQVDEAAAKEVQKLHEKLIELQTRMEKAVDADGNPLFKPADITRELWTPLVQADVIPSNAVADKYSQEAQVFNGACEIYKKKLEDYSKKASKHETAKRVIRIGTDVVSLLGTLASESIRLESLTAQASNMSRAENLTLAADKAASADGTATAEQLANIDRMTDMKQQAREATMQIAAVTLATTVINGGFSVLDAALTNPDDKRKSTYVAGIAKSMFNALGAAAASGISVYSAQVTATDSDKAFSQAFQTQMSIASKSVQAILGAGNAGFSLMTAVQKFADGDKAGGTAALQDVIASVAGAVGASISAVDVKRGTVVQDGVTTTSLGTEAQWQQIGATVQAGIAASANIPAIANHIYEVVKSNGGKMDVKVIIANLGLSAISGAMAGTMGEITGKVYSVPADGEIDRGTAEALFQKTTVEMEIFNSNADGASSVAAKAGPQLKPTAPTDDPAHVMEQRIRFAEQENARKAAALGDFKASMNDPARRDEFFKQIADASDRELEVLNKLLDDAGKPPQDLRTVEDEQRAMAAMDKLIAEANRCNMMWQALEVITGVGATVLAAALPGAGIAVAIQKLLIDATTLMRKSMQLNKWMDNMALTVGNSSVYGPAINGRLNSARVQVSLQVLRVIYDVIGLTAESIKLADASGASMGGGMAAGIALQSGATMARALTDFAYKMHKEAEIEAGWKLYKMALASPGDRKKARSAMKWNSTLSKCVIAYGIVVDGDPIAKEVGRSCGITPEVLADQKNVCPKVVTYFETLYSDDPKVLKRVPIPQKWHPGTPVPTLVSWLRFKAAATARATPPLAAASAKTPGIDGALGRLVGVLGPDADYAATRDARFPEYDATNLARQTTDYDEFLDDVDEAARAVITQLRAYQPVNADPADGDDWTGGTAHKEFVAIVESLTAQVQMIQGECANDRERHAAFKEQQQAIADALAGEDDDGDVADDDAGYDADDEASGGRRR
ncbi:MAG: hypothetical protein KF887_17345 [Paracoccaceae bacterium]|nr:MAG: hypothetical protein KF887_17345 [Paracoccaceae bacterium]